MEGPLGFPARWRHQPVTEGAGVVFRGKSPEAAPRKMTTAGRVLWALPFTMKVGEVRKLAGVLAGLVVLQKLAGEVWKWTFDGKSTSEVVSLLTMLHLVVGGRPLGIQPAQSSDGCQRKGPWSVERRHSSRECVPESRLDRQRWSFGSPNDGDGVPESRLMRERRGITSPDCKQSIG
jgi:hypothetical protein